MEDASQRGKSRETLIVDALTEVLRVLGSSKGSPHVRELLAQARFYDKAVKHWTTVPPTHAQLDAMFDLVVDLHGKVVASKR